MSTPFTVFRKYTGAMMVVLCVLLMISFVVADALPGMGRGSGGGGRAGATVATWNGGSMTERQLEEALRHRGVLDAFQRAVVTEGIRSAQAAGVDDLPMRVIPLQLRLTREQGVEQDVVRTKIFAQKAREAGMVVSDETVSQFLQALGRDRVSVEQMRVLINGLKVGGGRRATTAFLFDLVREELLTRAFVDSHRYLFNTVLPSEQWDDWLKVNRRIVLEAAPIEVDNFVGEVEDPTDEEVVAYYEEYKDRVARPDFVSAYGGMELPSPNPGFTTPEQVRVEYVVASFQDFIDAALPEVTDEEIEEFYNANREQFISADASLFGEDSLFDEPAAEEESDASSAERSELDAEPSDADSEPIDAEALNDANATEETASEDEPTADAEQAADEASDADAADAASDDIAEAIEEEEEEEESSAESDELESGDAEDTASEDGVVYESLEDVAEEIRTLIAQAKAAEAIDERIEEVRRAVNDDYNKYFDAVLDAEDAGQDPPEPPASLTDLQATAERFGLEHGSLAPASAYDLRETTAGKSIKVERSTGRTAFYFQLAFTEGALDLYEPVVTFDQTDRNRLLLIITERLEQETAELDEVRDEVVAAWKRERAAEIALERAETMATEAEQSGKSLTDFFVDDEDVAPFQTDPMSFLTIGSVSRQTGQVFLRMSRPESLVAAGPDLMEAAFDLAPGEVAAKINHDRSVAYLLRIAQALGTPEELQNEFLRDGATWYGAASTRQARRTAAALALFDTLLTAAELDWEREPDA
ncbi:MAG: hypothetical protein AAFV43_13955 [Planctomycetota bacterium]